MRVRFAMNAIFHSPLIIALQRELRVELASSLVFEPSRRHEKHDAPASVLLKGQWTLTWADDDAMDDGHVAEE
jgi:hypothetical protein